jgi:hypothetical protein
MAQFRVVELGQDAPSERRVVNVVKDVDGLGNPADFPGFPNKSPGASESGRIFV